MKCKKILELSFSEAKALLMQAFVDVLFTDKQSTFLLIEQDSLKLWPNFKEMKIENLLQELDDMPDIARNLAKKHHVEIVAIRDDDTLEVIFDWENMPPESRWEPETEMDDTKYWIQFS